MKWRYASVLVACWALTGCQADPTSPPAPLPQDANAPLALTQLTEQFTTLACTKLTQCCSASAVEQRLGVPAPTLAACHSILAQRYTHYVQRLLAAQASGRLLYDGTRVQRCLLSLQTLSCADYATQGFVGPAPGSDCDAWLAPQMALGGACADDNECISDYCEGHVLNNTGLLKDGVCTALPALGETCQWRCATGAFCDNRNEVWTCVAGRPPGFSCSTDAQCSPPICEHAQGSETGQGVCKPAPTACLGN